MTENEQRVGHWFCTASGRRFWPLDPRPEEVHIEDIAHSLAATNRFGGHTRLPYSVAQHSVLVAWWLEEQDYDPVTCFWGLMHDAAEAFCGDVIWPLKRAPQLAPYGDIEHRIMLAVAERFGLVMPEPPVVKQADLVLLATEKRDLMGGDTDVSVTRQVEVDQAAHAGRIAWGTDVSPWGRCIGIPWPFEVARAAFLRAFYGFGGTCL